MFSSYVLVITGVLNKFSANMRPADMAELSFL
jgi:hypothetical protein